MSAMQWGFAVAWGSLGNPVGPGCLGEGGGSEAGFTLGGALGNWPGQRWWTWWIGGSVDV